MSNVRTLIVGSCLAAAGAAALAFILWSSSNSSLSTSANGSAAAPSLPPDREYQAASAVPFGSSSGVILPAVTKDSAPVNAWDSAVQAAHSGQLGVVFDARDRVHECYGLAKLTPDLQLVLSGQSVPSSIRGSRTTERLDAIRSMLNRCMAFQQHGVVATRELMKSLDKQYEALAETAQIDISSDAPQDRLKLVQTLMKYGSPEALDSAFTTLLHLTPPSENTASASEGDIIDLALMSASCELGLDCSQTGQKMQAMCTLNDICGVTWKEYAVAQLSDEQKAVFNIKLKKIVDLYKSGAFASSTVNAANIYTLLK